MKIQIDTQSRRAVKEFTQRSNRLKRKHALVVVFRQIARTSKQKLISQGQG
jgi:hypothetical protein